MILSILVQWLLLNRGISLPFTFSWECKWNRNYINRCNMLLTSLEVRFHFSTNQLKVWNCIHLFKKNYIKSTTLLFYWYHFFLCYLFFCICLEYWDKCCIFHEEVWIILYDKFMALFILEILQRKEKKIYICNKKKSCIKDVFD